MKIYAIKDRLIDYFMQPFAGPEDKAVMAAIARTINNVGDMSDIAQAPHHFEIWQLGQVTEDGHLIPERALIADCASLVRPGLRTDRIRPGQATTDEPGEHRGPAGGNESPGRTNGGPIPIAPQAAPGATDEIRRGPQGGYPPRNDA